MENVDLKDETPIRGRGRPRKKRVRRQQVLTNRYKRSPTGRRIPHKPIAPRPRYKKEKLLTANRKITEASLLRRTLKPRKKRDPEKQNGYKNQFELFEAFYLSLPEDERCCYECGVPIGMGVTISNVHHIKPKGLYPLLKYRLENLVLCCDFHHRVYEFGLKVDRDKTKLYSNKEKLKALRLLDKELAANR